MYSLLSSAVLAADLARHPYGSRVADAVDRVLALRPDEAVALGTPVPDDVRQRVLETCARTPMSRLADAGAELAEPGGLSRLATRLEETLLGTLEDLHAMVLREEPVALLTPQQQQVVLDALTAAWAGPEASLRDLRLLAAPWQDALDPVPPALPERPWSPVLRQLLDDVPRRSLAQWAASALAHRAGSRSRWSEAVHTASMAAWQGGRVTDVARAQLAGARVLALSHTGVATTSAAMVVTAAVQAACTADLLADEEIAALTTAWEAGRPAR